jgi:hypothetical protein
MKQLANSRLRFQYTVGLFDYLNDPADSNMRQIRDSLRFCDDITICLKSLALTAETALVSDKSYVEYLIPRLYIDSNGRPLLQPVPEEVLSYHIVMILSKGNLLLESFDERISRIVESGLTVKWARDIMYRRSVSALSQESAGGRRLSMAHLQSMFVLLLIGEGLALVALIVEVVMRKIL